MNTADMVRVDRATLSLTLSLKGEGTMGGFRSRLSPLPPGERARERGLADTQRPRGEKQ